MKLTSLKYNVRNVFVRWRATLATIFGIAMLVLVYVCLQSMAAGLEKSSRDTGDPRNVMILRKGSTAESSSQITREQFQRLKYSSEIARDPQGRPFISADVLTVVSLPRLDGSGNATVSVRGMTPEGMQLRPQVRLVRGRWFVPGHGEIVTSTRVARRFGHCDLGGTLRARGRELRVVGLFDGGNTAFDSELWMDAEEARSVFELKNYSSVLVRASSSEAATALMHRIASDKAQPLRAETEFHYYEQQTRAAVPIKMLGEFLAVAMSVGALFAAMNTMYARIASRTREIGTLRVLGVRRRVGLRGRPAAASVASRPWHLLRHDEFFHFPGSHVPIPPHTANSFQRSGLRRGGRGGRKHSTGLPRSPTARDRSTQ